MNIESKNRRRFHRINIDKEANLELNGGCYDGCLIKNMSVGGMFVAGCPPQKNKVNGVIIIYNNTKSEIPPFQAAVSVAWSNEEGIGLEFTAMNPDSYDFLRTTLINNAEQRSVILHDLTRTCPFEIAYV